MMLIYAMLADSDGGRSMLSTRRKGVPWKPGMKLIVKGSPKRGSVEGAG